MEILITICARGGSKGIPGKNIKLLGDKPLIAYTIGHALEFAKHHSCDIALSTDDEQIRKVAAEYGIVTDYTRPAALATDTAGKIPVIAHLRNYEENRNGKEYDYLLDLDVSAPIRTLEDLLSGFEIVSRDSTAYNLFSVNKANKNPYFNMVEPDSSGYYGLCKRLTGNVESRQSAPRVYELNASFYYYSRSFFEDNQQSAITARSLIYEMPHICFDLDHPIDFDFMSYLLDSGKINL